MTVGYFNIPEITVSYKDKVKSRKRAVVKRFRDALLLFIFFSSAAITVLTLPAKRLLHHLPKIILYIDIDALLIDGMGSIVQSEDHLFQRIQIVRQ